MNVVRIRSTAGCWTCRLRRKKCDEKKPVCTNCDSLEITCHYGEKPTWMDAGPQEKQMADDLKRMVREMASKRREKRWLQGIGEGPNGQQDSIMTDGNNDDGDGSGQSPSTTASGNAPATSTTKSSSSFDLMSSQAAPPNAPNQFPGDRSDVEINFTMIYLDYVVPFLFPFYRPRLGESSRGWMLVLLMRNRTLFHTALSLANWFYAVMLDKLDGTHGACKTANWTELQTQQEIAMKAMQQDIQALNHSGVAGAFRDSIACLQSIIQLLEYEVAMANMAQWQAHLDAAVALFDQLLLAHADDSSKPWTSVMGRLGSREICGPKILSRGHAILTSEQTAFRFYTAYLLWIDIVAATARAEAPRLRKYHTELLEGDNPPVQLGEYVGCQNWAILAIAEIACLAARKREQSAAGSPMTFREVASAGFVIEWRVRGAMTADEKLLASTLPFSKEDQQKGSLANYNMFDPSAQPALVPYSGLGGEIMAADPSTTVTPAVALHTRIWAQAALTYLHVVISGLQPDLREIRMSVDASINLFRCLPSPLTLRTLIWPFVVTGCCTFVASGSSENEHAAGVGTAGEEERGSGVQEAFFADLVSRMGALQVIGGLQEAHSIMKQVWTHRGCIRDKPDIWDLATCLSILGHPSLMV